MGLCLLVGATGGAVTAGSVRVWYGALHQPPGTPPNWLFGPVWTALYVTIGISGWLVWRRRGPARELLLWGWQLAVNALWAPAFFGLHNLALGLAVLAVLLVLVGLTIVRFARVQRLAAWLMLPYFGWCCFAAYLNAGFWWLNAI
ncbi:MAG: tryptophan-rich sensory protein [Acetobacteraceae bacterium]|nr:tryptophan-rich sensory protein [Acetobacteraceae bacterium]